MGAESAGAEDPTGARPQVVRCRNERRAFAETATAPRLLDRHIAASTSRPTGQRRQRAIASSDAGRQGSRDSMTAQPGAIALAHSCFLGIPCVGLVFSAAATDRVPTWTTSSERKSTLQTTVAIPDSSMTPPTSEAHAMRITRIRQRSSSAARGRSRSHHANKTRESGIRAEGEGGSVSSQLASGDRPASTHTRPQQKTFGLGR